jgi:hypothetical protein
MMRRHMTPRRAPGVSTAASDSSSICLGCVQTSRAGVASLTSTNQNEGRGFGNTFGFTDSLVGRYVSCECCGHRPDALVYSSMTPDSDAIAVAAIFAVEAW